MGSRPARDGDDGQRCQGGGAAGWLVAVRGTGRTGGDAHCHHRNGGAAVEAIRLETLPDPKLPSGGPGRSSSSNFVLTDIAITAAPLSNPRAGQPVKISSVKADFSQDKYPIEHAIDADPKTGWGIAGKPSRHATFRGVHLCSAGPRSRRRAADRPARAELRPAPHVRPFPPQPRGQNVRRFRHARESPPRGLGPRFRRLAGARIGGSNPLDAASTRGRDLKPTDADRARRSFHLGQWRSDEDGHLRADLPPPAERDHRHPRGGVAG